MRPGVVLRGHGSDGAGAKAVLATSTPREVGDEPLLIQQRTGCPVMVGRDRAATGRALLAAHPEVDIVLTDDGLQHYALRRDIEIILFDGRGAGNGWLLPAGPLREPPSRRRDFTVVNAPSVTPALAASVAPGDGAGGANVAPLIQMTLAGDVAEQLRDRSQRRALSALRQPGLRIAAAAGIGNPARFFGMLKGFGLDIVELPLPDHHDFLDRPFDGLAADLILMTEKDAVKCAQIEELRDDPRLWVVPVTARIDAALADLIVEKCRGCSPA
jgi:tetraacyldisaccharide 4'-kinase